jgi:glutathione S-transferase
VVKPHARATVGPRTREAWTQPELAREFADVLAWRDAVYAKHR